ncbi:MAG: Gfo/Idh/MocA family oxidoreductase [Pseudolabrys sp.]
MLNIAMVGLGRWGQTILNSIQGKSERVRIVHGVSKEPDIARPLAEKYGFRLSTDLADAIADPQVQAVLLATPHSLHVGQVRTVAAAGKHVWCEKPLALTRAEAERSVAACREAGVLLATGNNKRCFASMRELKRVVDSGAIGEVLHIEGHFSNEHSTRVAGGWRDNPKESPGLGMTGAGLHVLDAFVNLAGPATYVDARSVSKKAPPDPRDVVAAVVEFAGGATGVMATVRAAPMFWRVHVFGTSGTVEARGEDTLIVAKLGGTPLEQTYPHADSLLMLIEAFADAIEGRAPFPVTTDQMLNVIGLFEATIKSLETGAPVEIKR